MFKLNDESVSDEASATFITLSQPLEVKVPQYIQSLPTATVILDASRSSDPDNAPENPKFFWACAKVIEIKKDTANMSTDGFQEWRVKWRVIYQTCFHSIGSQQF